MGGRLVKALMAEAKASSRGLHLPVYPQAGLLCRSGVIHRPARKRLPDKIYKDCHACPRFHRCDEVARARVRGSLPNFAILPEPGNWLVKLQSFAPEAENQTSPR